MSTIASIEDVRTTDEKQLKLIREALDRLDCKLEEEHGFYYIYVSVPSLAANRSSSGCEIHGIMIGLYKDDISVWIAEVGSDSYRSGYALGGYTYSMSLEEIISAAIQNADVCDYCKTNVGFENLVRIAFCNKSCKKCEEMARKRDMPRGWAD